MPHINSRHDPVGAAEIEHAKHGAAVAEFNARTISDVVFRAALFSLGFRGAALACEFRYHDDLRHENEKRAKKHSDLCGKGGYCPLCGTPA